MTSDDKFVEQYSSFVRGVAKSVKEQLCLDTELDDLVNMGFCGLLEAKQRFDPSVGVNFKTFAYYRVRGAVLDGVRKAAYLPRRAYARLRAAEVLDAEAEAAVETRAVTPQMRADIAASVRAIDKILGRIAAAYSIAAAAAESEDRSTTPESSFMAEEGKKAAIQAIEKLPERERFLVRGFYLEERPLDELAKELGVSRSWASRLHSKALDTLRETLDRR